MTTILNPTSGRASVGGYDVERHGGKVREAIEVSLSRRASRTTWSDRAAWCSTATFAFFPLIFLSYTFVPKEHVTTGWLKVAATINPTTYVFDSMRSLLNTGWNGTSLVVGFAVTFESATLTGIMALWAPRGATKLGMTIEQPSLDDVFLRVTGEALEHEVDEAAEDAPTGAEVTS